MNMTISTADFPAWFFVGFYGGLVCCVLAILISLSALYTAIKRRGVTRRLISVVAVCIASFLCLLPAFVWFHINTRLSLIEMTELLGYVVFFGWLLSIGTMVFYFVPSRSRIATIHKHDDQQRQKKPSSAELHPPRYQPGVQAPLVFSAETPWGWLEYRSGNFQGQRLALKRSIVTMGRDEDCDIWLDDDMASRKHAEVAWDESVVYLTDRDSLNGTRLNGRKIRGSVLLSSNDVVEIGGQRFLFLLTEQKTVTTEQYDPLVNHKWRSSFELQELRDTTRDSLPLPITKPPLNTDRVQTQSESVPSDVVSAALHTPPSLPTVRGMLLVRNGELAGKRFFLQSLSVTVGSGANCDLVVQDLELAPQHARFIRQAQGDYVQDLSGLSEQAGSLVNGESIRGMQLLRPGDHVQFGSFHLTYLSIVQNVEEQALPSPKAASVNPVSLSSGRLPLRLPSRQKES
jgi:pSer/pThr/pTyr-binding forkhead associated (FHA) protein